MNIVIRIDYISNGSKLYQVGSIPIRGKRTEQIALDRWKQTKKRNVLSCGARKNNFEWRPGHHSAGERPRRK